MNFHEKNKIINQKQLITVSLTKIEKYYHHLQLQAQ